MAYEIYDLTNIAGTGTLNGDLFEPTTWNGEIYALELGSALPWTNCSIQGPPSKKNLIFSRKSSGTLILLGFMLEPLLIYGFFVINNFF